LTVTWSFLDLAVASHGAAARLLRARLHGQHPTGCGQLPSQWVELQAQKNPILSHPYNSGRTLCNACNPCLRGQHLVERGQLAHGALGLRGAAAHRRQLLCQRRILRLQRLPLLRAQPVLRARHGPPAAAAAAAAVGLIRAVRLPRRRLPAHSRRITSANPLLCGLFIYSLSGKELGLKSMDDMAVLDGQQIGRLSMLWP